MLRLLGAFFLILIGAAVGAQMCAGPPSPPPPLSQTAGARLPTMAANPLPTAKPSSAEEKIAVAKAQEQQNRTFVWDGGWLRLETIEFLESAARMTITLFVSQGDLFYVDLAGTSLVAGPVNVRAVSTNIPVLSSPKPWQTVYRAELQSLPGPRVPEATATTYSVDFPPIDAATLPDRVFAKLRFWQPSERDKTNTIVLATGGSSFLQHGQLASFVWEAAPRRP